ncbi:Short-chain dehydrogenase/reductase SDR [Candidatus Terasakiella magnetica]|uniref:Short-chain dehydrogenase/reductase SDR n=1 Tax=Candidatus Terasakiella magnetica TaxID=1867952 RepID=A0A1C3RH24_9PROT|nr:SDR family NAD(P)-dependent oxidoreductase [Candidatus Terasakiella magnetica]SCA56558.1 Short-chain dehydrogenase/reductase SDR [Candidatus Terasakiella magnetica]
MKKVWITGGGSGIGKALALRLVEEKYQVFISGRNMEKLVSVGWGTIPVLCDITNTKNVKNALDEIGPIDLAILNAGTYEPGPTINTSIENMYHAMEVNYFGTVNCIQALLPYMKKHGGHLAVVASLAGYRGLPNASGYGPSKAAVINLCESMKAELYDTQIKLQLINPGFVKSPLTDKNSFDMPYLMEPDEAAAEIIKGLNSNAFEIAFPSPFVRQMKILKWLPDRFYFPLIRKLVK